eukprot:s6461_g1.t1
MACCGAAELTPLAQHAKAIKCGLDGGVPETIMHFPMYTVPLAKLLEMTEIEPHEVLMEKDVLVEFRRSRGNALFVSHQWVEKGHPDPDCQQFRVLQEALKNVLAGHWQEIPVDFASEGAGMGKPLPIGKLLSAPLFFWYDYFSCPQAAESRSKLRNATSSIPAYVGECEFFLALVPVSCLANGRTFFGLTYLIF